MIADHLTVADIPLGCVAYRWYALPIERPELPNLRAWYQRLTTAAGLRAARHAAAHLISSSTSPDCARIQSA